jgi:uncharacterized membrane protein
MQFDPLEVFSKIPVAALPPFCLLLFSVVIKLVVHGDRIVDNLNSVPPRLALAAIGITLTAALSPKSFLSVHAGADRFAFVLAVLILFLALYVVCEAIHARAGKRGSYVAAIVGGSLSFGLATLAVHYARAPQ